MPGLKWQKNVEDLLINWRRYRYVVTADIVKMFRGILVHPQDRHLQCILWRYLRNQKPLKAYELKTVTYGTACAPWLAIRTLIQLANDEQDNYPEGARILKNEMYVDDALFGGDTPAETRERCRQLAGILMTGGFDLAKWSSNCPDILKLALQRQVVELSPHETVKTLGVDWWAEEDCFSYTINVSSREYTRRSILSDIARIFDPCGWLAPVTIRAKLIIQDLWLTAKGWDDPLDDNVRQTWREWAQDVESLKTLKIPRWLGSRLRSKLQLHGFSDASQRAYAATIYARCEDDTTVITKLILAKTRVAPIKTITLPRLELCGAALTAKLLAHTFKVFAEQEIETYLWTDSTVVLTWLQNHPSRWPVFVANRVSDIHTTCPATQFRYVPTKSNPADCATRGLQVDEFITNDLWWHGPDWLKHPPPLWPKPKSISKDRKIEVVMTTQALVETVDPTWDLLERFSKYSRLVRVTTWCIRFCKKTRNLKSMPRDKDLTVDEIEESERYWIKSIQCSSYMKEVKSLTKNRQLNSDSRLLPLTPFVDENGLLRVGGRLKNSLLPFFEKHPIILPSESRLTYLLASEMRERTLHGGIQLMMSELSRRYWVVGARRIVKTIVHRCLRCKRYSKTLLASQLMGQLPADRITPSKPFANAGVDYCGPFILRTSGPSRGRKTYKAYIALFVCMVTRAVHIEVVGDLTTEAFLAAFRRFVSRRGTCRNLYSDNATNFQGAEAELKRMLLVSTQQWTALAESLSKDRCQWHFITPRAPHMGGIWEVGVKSIKYHLRRVIGETILTFEELTTITAQIECCLNSRPISAMHDDPNGYAVLTPGHFLVGTSVDDSGAFCF